MRGCAVGEKNSSSITTYSCFQINTMSGGTVQMQLEYKSIRKTGLEQLKSPSSVATAMGYETLNRLTIPMESVFSGTGDLQDKIKPMPTTVSSI